MSRTVCGRCEMDVCRCNRREATYLPAPSERRERIATAALQGMFAYRGDHAPIGPRPNQAAEWAVVYADALIAELDKEPKP